MNPHTKTTFINKKRKFQRMATKFQKDEHGFMVLPVLKRDKPKAPPSNTIIGWGCVIVVIAVTVAVETGFWAWAFPVK